MEEKVEKTTVDKSVDNIITKKEKVAKILFIIGVITFVIFLISFISWAIVDISHIVTEDEKLDKTIEMVAFLIYFGIPSLVFGVITTALNTTSLILSKNRKVLKFILLTLSALLLIFDIILFILL